MAWVSPTGHNDPSSAWTTEELAYDNDLGTRATSTSETAYLELTHSAILCDKVRIYVSDYFKGIEGTADLDIDVYYGDAWHNIFSGSIAKLTWAEKSIGSTQIVTAARVKFNQARIHRVYEFDFNSLPTPPIVETDACTDVKSTSLDANGDILASFGATKRGFHYSKVFDGFEWGGDTDPLDDSGGAITWNIVAAGSSKVEIDTAQHYSGTRCARLYRDGSNHADAKFSHSPLANDEVWSMRVRKDATSRLLFYHGNGSKLINYAYWETEQLGYADAGGWHWTGIYIGVGEWALTEVRNVNWGAGTYDLYHNGVLIVSGATMRVESWNNGELRYLVGAGTAECWIDEVAVWDVEDEDGSFSEGEYSLEITGLDPATTYYVQAFARNSVGYGYGSVVSQVTAPAADHRRSSFLKMF